MTGMTIIVKTVSNWVKVLIVLFGIYIILFGHLTPGGGFAGGVILASSYVLLMLAFGGESVQKDLPLSLVSKLDCLGAFMFALIAILGLVFSGVFFVIGLKVGASLFLVIFLLSTFRRETPAKKSQISRIETDYTDKSVKSGDESV